jgi:hypothetical protein
MAGVDGPGTVGGAGAKPSRSGGCSGFGGGAAADDGRFGNNSGNSAASGRGSGRIGATSTPGLEPWIFDSAGADRV